ncbi:MAG: glycosyltransferase family 4 protein [Acidobacteriota bacterium]
MTVVAPDLANRPERLWVVSELYYPEETSTGYYLTRIAEGLTDDFDVKALCGQPNYSARGTRAPKRETHNGVDIFRVAGTTLNKNVILFRLLNMITLSVSTFVRAVVSFRSGDNVLVVTTPPSLPFVVAAAALLRGAHYTLLIHDNYPEILFAVGKSTDNSTLAHVLNFANRWLYKNTSKIVAVGRDMKVLLERKTAGLETSIVVIPNWAELETVQPEPRETNALLTELGLAEKFVLLYAGNMGHPNDLETIVSAAKHLADEPHFHFIFLGTGVKEPWLRRLVADFGLTNITILRPKPRSEQIVFLNACDIALVSLVKKMWGVSMPSRTYNILAAGKPILALAESYSELSLVIDDDQVGWHVQPGEVEELVSHIHRIYDEREQLNEIGARARQAALANYTLELAVGRYRDALTN